MGFKFINIFNCNHFLWDGISLQKQGLCETHTTRSVSKFLARCRCAAGHFRRKKEEWEGEGELKRNGVGMWVGRGW